MSIKGGILRLSDVEKEFDRLLLTNKEGNSIKRGVLRDSLKQIVKDAKANLIAGGHVKTGDLLNSLGVIVKVRRDTAYAATGASTKGEKKGYHFHFVNSGTGDRTTSNKGGRGAAPATEFFDNAVRANLSSIPAKMQESFARRMKIFMDKKY